MCLCFCGLSRKGSRRLGPRAASSSSSFFFFPVLLLYSSSSPFFLFFILLVRHSSRRQVTKLCYVARESLLAVAGESSVIPIFEAVTSSMPTAELNAGYRVASIAFCQRYNQLAIASSDNYEVVIKDITSVVRAAQPPNPQKSLPSSAHTKEFAHPPFPPFLRSLILSASLLRRRPFCFTAVCCRARTSASSRRRRPTGR